MNTPADDRKFLEDHFEQMMNAKLEQRHTEELLEAHRATHAALAQVKALQDERDRVLAVMTHYAKVCRDPAYPGLGKVILMGVLENLLKAFGK
jgi:hypothetical protein